MRVRASIVWRRLDVPGHDVCRLEEDAAGWRLSGDAVFDHASGRAEISYGVNCARDWTTSSGHIHGQIGHRRIDCHIACHGGVWTLNGEAAPAIGHLHDLDLSFTPATNFLQIKRVHLPRGEAVSLPAAWFNLDAGALTELRQTYTRRDERTLHYAAPDVGYEGMLELAPNGFIRRYPGLWEAE